MSGAPALRSAEPGSRNVPFPFQHAGARARYAGTGPVITAAEVRDGWSEARDDAAAHVGRIVARLPGRERELVEATAEMEPEDRTASTPDVGLARRAAMNEDGAVA